MKTVLVLSYSLFSFFSLAIPNPASKYCVENGGSLNLYESYGICWFLEPVDCSDRNCQQKYSECEEWAYFRGQCTKGSCQKWHYENTNGGVSSYCERPYQL